MVSVRQSGGINAFGTVEKKGSKGERGGELWEETTRGDKAAARDGSKYKASR